MKDAKISKLFFTCFSVKPYFIERILPELSAKGFMPNERFYKLKRDRFGV